MNHIELAAVNFEFGSALEVRHGKRRRVFVHINFIC